MNIKLIALDMDGTLLDSDKNMPESFIPWVKAHPSVKTVIASGRQYYTILRDFPAFSDDLVIVAENGALIFDHGEQIFMDSMPKEDIHKALNIVESMSDEIVPIVCGRQSAYILSSVSEEAFNQSAIYYERIKRVDDLHFWADNDDILKIALFFAKCDAEGYLGSFEELGSGVCAILSGDRWIDIANKSVNKGSAIRFMLSKFNISPDEAAAFGDYLNDASMLEACTESYCMENGHPDLKAISKHIAPSNDDDGVMRVLSKIVD